MLFDLDSQVTLLCAAGMQVDGEPDKALALFMQAWESRRDDFEASVAAHFVARHQPTTLDALHWNEIALHHADRVQDGRAASLLPSLCLNLAESYRVENRHHDAERLAERGWHAVNQLPTDDGYAQFVRGGLERLLERLRTTER